MPKYSDDELRLRINSGQMTDAELDAIPMARLKEMAQADMDEQQHQEQQTYQKAETQQVSAEKVGAETPVSEMEKQIEPTTGRKFEEMSLDEIEQASIEAQEKARLAETPEAKLEAEAQSSEQRVADLQYVEGELRKTTSAQLDQLIAQKIQEQRAVETESLRIQQEFVNSHSDYVASPENGAALVKFHQENGYTRFSPESLDVAYVTLKSRGALYLLSAEQIQARQKLAEAIQTDVTPQPRHRSSSVSASRSEGFYSRPVKSGPTEEELETMPLSQLKDLANSNADPVELQEERRRGSILSNF